VPDRILIAFVAELKLYGFRYSEGAIPELLWILEKQIATESASV
jgi:hypothetical protein